MEKIQRLKQLKRIEETQGYIYTAPCESGHIIFTQFMFTTVDKKTYNKFKNHLIHIDNIEFTDKNRRALEEIRHFLGTPKKITSLKETTLSYDGKVIFIDDTSKDEELVFFKESLLNSLSDDGKKIVPMKCQKVNLESGATEFGLGDKIFYMGADVYMCRFSLDSIDGRKELASNVEWLYRILLKEGVM